MTVVVTGALGQLGAELCRQFGPEAVGLDLPEFDLTDSARVFASLRAIRPQAVVNAAAFTGVDDAERDPARCRAVNVEGSVHLERACRSLDCPLVQISTDYVFGRDPGRRTPYRETDETGPLGVYAQSKWESETVVRQWPKHLIVRTCGLYGRPAERSAGNFVETMLRLSASRARVRVVADQRCTPTYTPHMARAVRFLLTLGARGTYHVSNAGDTTWYEFAQEIFGQAGRHVEVEPIPSAEWAAAAPRPAYSVLDCSKYLAIPGAPSLPPWEKALREYLRCRLDGKDG